MFDPIETAKIKSVLGKWYTKAIYEHFLEKGILNSKGEPIQRETIKKIVNGRHNPELEQEITQFVIEFESKRQRKRKKLQNL